MFANSGNCDVCKEEAVSWKFWRDGIYINGIKKVDLTVDTIYSALRTILIRKGSVGASRKADIIWSVCPKCWIVMARIWGKEEGTSEDGYMTARAKTTREGVFLQTEDPAFQKNIALTGEAPPQLQPIVSCLVHELIHYWSAESVGVQAYLNVEGVNWDEILCDFFAYPTYQEIARSNPLLANYVGPYSTNGKFLERAISYWEEQINVARVCQPFLAKEEERQKLPKPLKEYFDKFAIAPVVPRLPGMGGGPPPPVMGGGPPPPRVGGGPPPPRAGGGPPSPGMGGAPMMGIKPARHGTDSKALYETTLNKYLATWFFQGPGFVIDGMNFSNFISAARINQIFQKRGQVFVNFNEVATPI